MREITIHKSHDQDRQPKLMAMGHIGTGGGEQFYKAIYQEREDWPMSSVALDFITLDRGGITNEALLAVVIDRLDGFQAGPFNCAENEEARNAAKNALDALHRRTLARIERGVENQAKV